MVGSVGVSGMAKITYQTVHGTAPVVKNVGLDDHLWYKANRIDDGYESIFPNPRLLGFPAVDNTPEGNYDEMSDPCYIIQDPDSETYVSILDANTPLMVWDNGDDTFKFYISDAYNGGNDLTFDCVSALNDLSSISEKSHFVLPSEPLEEGVRYYLTIDENGVGFTLDSSDPHTDWKFLWGCNRTTCRYAVTPDFDEPVPDTDSESIYILTEEDLPTLEADGYTFKGWTLNGEPTSTLNYITDDATLTAVWEEVVVEPEEPELSRGQLFLLYRLFSPAVFHALTGKWHWME